MRVFIAGLLFVPLLPLAFIVSRRFHQVNYFYSRGKPRDMENMENLIVTF